MYVDVHTHLTHEDFGSDLPQVIQRAQSAGLGALVVNGLEPESNRKILAMAQQYKVVRPALGIYPIDAVNDILPADLPFEVARFDVQQEIDFIRSQAKAGTISAIGECGLDGYWIHEETFARQEKVFLELVQISVDHKLPVIIHTRKLEARAMEILQHHGVKRVNFHCFGGKVKLAQQGAEKHGWWFSIPANATVNEAFRKMLAVLPPEKILTETDAPYLPPTKGQRNEPANVVGTVALLADLRGWTTEAARDQVWKNFLDLFGS